MKAVCGGFNGLHADVPACGPQIHSMEVPTETYMKVLVRATGGRRTERHSFPEGKSIISNPLSFLGEATAKQDEGFGNPL